MEFLRINKSIGAGHDILLLHFSFGFVVFKNFRNGTI